MIYTRNMSDADEVTPAVAAVTDAGPPRDLVAAALVNDLEQVVMSSVALMARVLAEVTPDLTFLQWRVLVILGAADGDRGVSVGEVAADLGARVPATSRVLTRLRARGLVAVGRDAHDGRLRMAQLTIAGRAMHDTVRERRRSELAWAFSRRRLALADAGAARRIAQALQHVS